MQEKSKHKTANKASGNVGTLKYLGGTKNDQKFHPRIN
jgi:hypothetical protein